MVQKGKLTNEEAHKKLKGTLSKDKNEILFNDYKINYNDEPEICKRGSIFIRMKSKKDRKRDQKAKDKEENKNEDESMSEEIILVHDDLIEKECFYEKYDLY